MGQAGCGTLAALCRTRDQLGYVVVQGQVSQRREVAGLRIPGGPQAGELGGAIQSRPCSPHHSPGRLLGEK